MSYTSRCLILLLIVVSAVVANAKPVTWTFQNVTFGNGSTATLTGSFTFDADTDTYSNINITIVAGANGAGVQAATYQFLDPSATSNSSTLVATVNSNFLDGQPVLFFFFTTPLTDAGGMVNLNTATSETAICSGPLCPSLKTGPTGPMFSITSGSVTAPVTSSGSDGTYQIGYAANLNIGDSEINISNDGALAGFYNNNTTGLGAGNICVNVYTFDPSEEEVSCCACLVTPNALVSLSAKNDLISDVLTPAIPTSIVIKLIASVPATATGGVYTTCNPTTTITGGTTGTAPNTTPNTLALGLLPWGTTLEPSSPAGTYGPVNVPFINGNLSASELLDLTSVCSFVQQEGTGFGVCKSCALGALSGTKQ